MAYLLADDRREAREQVGRELAGLTMFMHASIWRLRIATVELSPWRGAAARAAGR